ncbi:hypothetical protein ACIBF5_25085 [Micromonospora sp. NPDC050417]|uniref:hypothetical protein n=1 Tax=Micromonospora sp. NPDC050417 TaxID=3364280 RepID=UPI0037B38938
MPQLPPSRSRSARRSRPWRAAGPTRPPLAVLVPPGTALVTVRLGASPDTVRLGASPDTVRLGASPDTVRLGASPVAENATNSGPVPVDGVTGELVLTGNQVARPAPAEVAVLGNR